MTCWRKRTENYAETKVDDEILLVDLDGGELFSLSGTAAAIWELIDGTRDETAILSQLARSYAIEAEAVREEIGQFVADLERAALIARS